MTATLAFPPREADLVVRMRAGDAIAFEEMVREHGGRLLCVARRFLRCEDDRADAVQETFLSAYRNRASFQGDSRLGTWLHRILVNVCLTKLRSRSRRPEVPLDDLLPAFDEAGRHAAPVPRWTEAPEDRLARAEVRAHVRACIDRLPAAYRSVLVLRDIEEMDTEQTAAALGTTPGAVKIRLHRARQALRALLEPAFRDE